MLFPSPIIIIQLELFGLTCRHSLDGDLTRGKEVDSGDGSASNGHKALAGLAIDPRETVEVFEVSLVGSSDSQLALGQLGEDTECSHVGVGEHGLLSSE